jgi:Glycoside hydrolase 123 N-terminal domain/F5/8 type C domain/Glycoside hydrolase 123, catalytic domain
MKLHKIFAAVMAIACYSATAIEYKPVKIKASSELKFYKGHLAKYAGDGKVKPRQYWCSDFKSKAKLPHWLEFDFGKPVKFNCIKLYMHPKQYAIFDEFSLQYNVDGKWQTIVNKKDYILGYLRQKRSPGKNKYSIKSPEPYPEFRFPAIVSDKVRLLVKRVPDGNARLHEMIVSLAGKTKVADRPVLKKLPTSFNCFDFGPAKLNTFKGFSRISPLSKYNTAKGFGWLAPRRILAGDRTYEYWLKRDFLVSEKDDSTFRIKVKPGNYCLTVFSGDALLNTPALRFSGNGKNFSMPKNFAGQFYWNTFPVSSRNGFIDLKLKAPWLINAVILAPEKKLKELNKLISEIQLHPGCSMTGSLYKYSPVKTWTRKPQITAKNKKNGFICYLPSPQQRIFPQTTPRKTQYGEMLKIAAAKGEFEAATVAVYALKTIRQLKVKVGQLKNSKGVVLPTDSIELRTVRCWPQRGGQKGKSKNWLVMPELLEKYKAQLVPAHSSRQFWLTLHAPANAKPGIYTTTLKVQADKGPEKSIKLQFKIYPFALRCPPKKVFAIYQQDPALPLFANQDSSREFDLKKLKDMRRHGMNSVVLNIRSAKQPLSEILKTIKRCNELLDTAGFPKRPIPYYCFNLETTYKPESIAKIQAAVKKNAWRELLFYPIDEPFHGPKLKRAIPIYRALKSIKGLRTYSTVYQNSVDKLGDSLDVRCFAVSGAAKFDAERIRRDCQKQNKTFWWYSNSTREYPAVARFKAGYFFWKTGSDGQFYWAYMNKQGDAFNDFDRATGDYCVVYPLNHEPTPTIQWEELREGIDDFKYLYTLEQAIKRVSKTKPAECAKARQLLAKIRKETLVDLKEYKKRFGSDLALHIRSAWAPEKYDRYRRQVAEQIVRLLK